MGTLTIAIDRTSLALSPLVFSAADDGTTWGILPGFVLPGRVARTRYAPSNFQHGDVATGSTWQHARLSWDAIPDVATAAALQTAEDELYAAVGQFSYDVTVTKNGVVSVWACDTGSAEPAPLDLMELDHNEPVYSITIPCYPVGA